jgi:hypothetical protein
VNAVGNKNYTLALLQKHLMAGNNMVTGLTVVVLVGVLVYLVDPTFFGLLRSKQGFADMMQDKKARESAMANSTSTGEAGNGMHSSGPVDTMNTTGNPNVASGDLRTGSEGGEPVVQGFADLGEGPANFGSSQAPAGCYPRDQLTPSELLPRDQNSVWAEQNPMGPGSLKGKNFLSAGALIGVNTVGQSLRNANWQLRSEPPNPQVPVSIFNQSTIQPDTNRRPLEIN